MKLNFLFLFLFGSFIFGQTTQDSIKDLRELDFDKHSLENLQNYSQKLSKTQLHLSHKAEFKGIFYQNKGNSINFGGKAKYNNKLHLKTISFDGNLGEKNEEVLHKLFNQIYLLIYNYHSFSQNKNNILHDFHCIQIDDNKWEFRIHKKNSKEKLNVNTSNKMNFIISLNENGNVEYIQTFLDSSKGFHRDDKSTASHHIEVFFSTHQHESKIISAHGSIFNPSTNNKVKLNIIF